MGAGDVTRKSKSALIVAQYRPKRQNVPAANSPSKNSRLSITIEITLMIWSKRSLRQSHGMLEPETSESPVSNVHIDLQLEHVHVNHDGDDANKHRDDRWRDALGFVAHACCGEHTRVRHTRPRSHTEPTNRRRFCPILSASRIARIMSPPQSVRGDKGTWSLYTARE